MFAVLGRYAFGLLVVLSSLAAAAQGDLPRLESFFSNPSVSGVRVSPDNRQVAILQRDGSSGRFLLAVADIGELSKLRIVAGFDNADVMNVRWINNHRLSFQVGDMQERESSFSGNLYAVNADGGQRVQLTAGNWHYQQEALGSNIKKKVLPAEYRFYSNLHDGSDDIIVSKTQYNKLDYSVDSVRLYRLNTINLKLDDLVSGVQPEKVSRWLLDTDGRPVIAESFNKGRQIISYRATGKDDWETLASFDYISDKGFSPLFFDFKGDLYVTAAKGDVAALYRYDLKAKRLIDEPLFSVKGFDFDGLPDFDYTARKLMGVFYWNDAGSVAWFDSRMKEIQKRVDDALPDTTNVINCGACSTTQQFVIEASSDRKPTSYYMYDDAAAKLIRFAESRPDIKPDQMGLRDFYRYRARDGREIPVYVTVPAGGSSQPRPTVVLVHGGPNVRGAYWAWEQEAQFLASRGYLVLQPEFRGSVGFGFDHFRAGWKQWGGAMQDDLVDVVRWAADKGWTDQKRVAIMGASYGGYATLMGLAKNPEVFRCGVEWAGVTDIKLMFTYAMSDMSNEFAHYGAKTLIGDPDIDAASFKLNSPVYIADKISQPLLMAHGGNDWRVPIVHGTDFHSAIRKTNKQVEWVEYPEEGHGWSLEKNRFDFWRRVEMFLARNLAPGQ
ncbi:alpha/beta hydrolase family protein [Chitinimonas sp.]|uniref:alpha/beta hydrolase family protein n=1 Tax=Chitinimonas sp. TaxID=1934313 RepID=UPI0035AFBD26